MVRKIALPHWLDGQTIALLTLLVALGAMMQTGFSNVGGEIADLRSEMRHQIGELRGEMQHELGQLRGEMQHELGQLRSEMQHEIGQLRSEMQLEIAQLRNEMAQLRREIRADLQRIDDRLRNVELEVAAIKVGMGIFDGRLTALEAHHATQSDLGLETQPPS